MYVLTLIKQMKTAWIKKYIYITIYLTKTVMCNYSTSCWDNNCILDSFLFSLYAVLEAFIYQNIILSVQSEVSQTDCGLPARILAKLQSGFLWCLSLRSRFFLGPFSFRRIVRLTDKVSARWTMNFWLFFGLKYDTLPVHIMLLLTMDRW